MCQRAVYCPNIFCQLKYFLGSRIPGSTTISTSELFFLFGWSVFHRVVTNKYKHHSIILSIDPNITFLISYMLFNFIYNCLLFVSCSYYYIIIDSLSPINWREKILLLYIWKSRIQKYFLYQVSFGIQKHKYMLYFFAH